MIRKLFNKFKEKLFKEYIDDEISSWIYDYWSDLYNEYIGDSNGK